MSRIRYWQLPDEGFTYIEPNTRNAAIPNNGIVAFLRSTEFYVLTSILAYLYGIPHTHFLVLRQTSVFLFDLIPDKPSYHNERFYLVSLAIILIFLHITIVFRSVWQCYISKYP